MAWGDTSVLPCVSPVISTGAEEGRSSGCRTGDLCRTCRTAAFEFTFCLGHLYCLPAWSFLPAVVRVHVLRTVGTVGSTWVSLTVLIHCLLRDTAQNKEEAEVKIIDGLDSEQRPEGRIPARICTARLMNITPQVTLICCEVLVLDSLSARGHLDKIPDRRKGRGDHECYSDLNNLDSLGRRSVLDGLSRRRKVDNAKRLSLIFEGASDRSMC
jgi:hypothetical protein